MGGACTSVGAKQHIRVSNSQRHLFFESAFLDCDWPDGIPGDCCCLLEKVFKVRNEMSWVRNQMQEGAQLVGSHGLLQMEKLVF